MAVDEQQMSKNISVINRLVKEIPEQRKPIETNKVDFVHAFGESYTMIRDGVKNWNNTVMGEFYDTVEMIQRTLPPDEAIVLTAEVEASKGGLYITTYPQAHKPSQTFLPKPIEWNDIKPGTYGIFRRVVYGLNPTKEYIEKVDPSKAYEKLKEEVEVTKSILHNIKKKPDSPEVSEEAEKLINLINQKSEEWYKKNKHSCDETFKLCYASGETVEMISRETGIMVGEDSEPSTSEEPKEEPSNEEPKEPEDNVIIDVPGGGYAVASINKYKGAALRPERLSHGEESDIIKKLIDLYQEKFNLNLEINKRLYEISQGMVDSKPPIPPPPVPGNQEVDVPISDAILMKLAGKHAFLGNHMASCIKALMNLIPEIRAVINSLIDDETNFLKLTAATHVYGHYKRRPEKLGLGDVVLLKLAPGDKGTWGIVIQARDVEVTKVAVCKSMNFEILEGDLGVPLVVWGFRPWKQFDDFCEFGKFWGPQMRKMYDMVLSSSLDVFKLTSILFGNTPYAVQHVYNFNELMSKLKTELHMADDRIPIYPGCILFNDNDYDIGVLLSDGRIYGTKGYNLSQYMSWNYFAPKYVFYPHL